MEGLGLLVMGSDELSDCSFQFLDTAVRGALNLALCLLRASDRRGAELFYE
jgi:hypothetical protein